jgi:hypothetical protein
MTINASHASADPHSDARWREIAAKLRGTPVNIATALVDLPKQGGFYAWWIKRGSIDAVPSRPHPSEPDLDLLYVGIAPGRASSPATIRSRVVRNHIGGNIAASTFRLTLAALLQAKLGITPVRRKTKIVLLPEQNQALSTWQREHLRLTWAESAKPWILEDVLIAELKPPLNLAKNLADPFHPVLTHARALLHQTRKPKP